MLRLQQLSLAEKVLLHESALAVLKNTGVVFHSDEALKVFKAHGIKTQGKTVYINEAQVTSALESAPKSFTLHGRGPETSIEVGGGQVAMAAGYGAPFVMEPDGRMRPALMRDYENFGKLIHTSKQIGINNFLVVEPEDLPRSTAYLDMLFCTMTVSDKPMMSCAISEKAFDDNIAMANILFGGSEAIMDYPVMFPTINPLSPCNFRLRWPMQSWSTPAGASPRR
jgi:trimethylamine--corrinoid protein Co-methyltransferase